MRDIITFLLAILAGAVLYFFNVVVINDFANWVYSHPIHTEGKVIIGIIAAVAEIGEIGTLLSVLRLRR
ncbi:MAG TPA: hypothetical protein VEG28_01025 [Dehalococcoidia bacterium]|nr:hypothetical protein [Dehalococcoidia bacterium]